MKGIPKDFNYTVKNKQTGEITSYKTLNEIAKQYNTNYYTVQELYKLNSNDKSKNMGRKLKNIYDKIIILNFE